MNVVALDLDIEIYERVSEETYQKNLLVVFDQKYVWARSMVSVHGLN